MKAKELVWVSKGKHSIYRTEGCEFATIPVLEHSVGPAGFEVYEDDRGWTCTFWHGNMGHTKISGTTKDVAKQTAQNHINAIIESLI